MVSWNNLDTLASYKELFDLEKVDLKAVMTGENGADAGGGSHCPCQPGSASGDADRPGGGAGADAGSPGRFR